MSKSVLKIWGREFELNIAYECYPGEEVLDSQRAEFELLKTTDVVESALESVQEYVIKTAGEQIEAPIENIFKYVMPKSVFVPHNKKSPSVAIMCNYKFDMEHGIAVVFEHGKYVRVETQETFL